MLHLMSICRKATALTMKIDFVRLNRLHEDALDVENEGSCAQKPLLMTNSPFLPSRSLFRGAASPATYLNHSCYNQL